ncbi:MAG: homoserine O-acetyltransferase MetX, partial [Lentisphaeria bacterium]
SVGIVEPQQVVFYDSPEDRLHLESGKDFGPVTVQYETYGQLNKEADNAILICHALSGDAHAAGYHTADDEKAGWWDDMVGPGKAFDTDYYYVICANVLGSCKGTTGPASINPQTGAAYGLTFPVVTIADMVKVQKRLIEYLDIKQLLAIIGGSMGGMQALEWGVRYPDSMKALIPIATTPRLSPQGIAFNEVGRQAIFADPNWEDGNYYQQQAPEKGLAIARMIGHITYLSEKSMREKFGRDLRYRRGYAYQFEKEFQVESYLNYQGQKFTSRFDANSYLYLTKAMDYFDLTGGGHSLRESVKSVNSKVMIVAFSGDWLFPAYQNKQIANALRNNGIDVTYVELQSDYGHDAFLIELEQQTTLISAFLSYLYREQHPDVETT